MSNYKTTLQSNNESLSSNNIDLQGLIDQANALPDAGGVDLPELSNEGSASDLLSGKQLIDSDGNVVTGTIKTRNSSSVTINNGDINVSPGYYSGYITKSLPKGSYNITDISINDFGTFNYNFTAVEGYISGGKGTAGFGKSIPTQNAKTITPTKSQQIAVESGLYTLGDVVVEAIPSQYITTTDATASADEIMSGETAYVNGNKVTGTFSIDNELDTQDDLIAQIQIALQTKTATSGGITLPTLSNPATAENLEEGYELIDGDGNVVVGTHVCSGGGDSNIAYFTVQNNLPDDLVVNGIYCPIGESTQIPYSTDFSTPPLFAFPYGMSNEYTIHAPYIGMWEDDNGDKYYEDMNGAPMYSVHEVFGFITGMLMDFYPDPCAVLNNTITFEAEY